MDGRLNARNQARTISRYIATHRLDCRLNARNEACTSSLYIAKHRLDGRLNARTQARTSSRYIAKHRLDCRLILMRARNQARTSFCSGNLIRARNIPAFRRSCVSPGSTIFGFTNSTALAANIAGRKLWVVVHGRKPNSKKPWCMDHDQHLILCTQVPQDPLPIARLDACDLRLTEIQEVPAHHCLGLGNR